MIVLSFQSLPHNLAAQAPDALFDVVIKNGRVLDGAGNPWIVADVAIKDGRFVQIGKVAGKGRREIDASGKYVSPGWIDMLDQSGSVLQRNGLAETKLRQGITTGIGGEGGTPVEAEKIAEYFSGLEKTGISMNFGTYYNEMQARVVVLGNDSREPTPDELVRMKSIMDTAMKGGAMGDDNGPDLSAGELCQDGRVGRNGEGGRAAWRNVRKPHSRRRKRTGRVDRGGDRDRRTRAACRSRFSI